MKRRPPKSPLFPYPPLFRPSPSSAATCDTGRPPRTAATASRLNASGKVRRFLPPLSTIDTSQALQPIRSVRSRSEEHTSELQSRQYLVCRLLLEKKKKHNTY